MIKKLQITFYYKFIPVVVEIPPPPFVKILHILHVNYETKPKRDLINILKSTSKNIFERIVDRIEICMYKLQLSSKK